ncbi:MAG TPA: chorismate mutase [Pseudonocardiaceae bacterium]|jgi:chorismate mutase|nr:chorismate mutase [Pseudonocardiaceae bacterium]
MITTPTREIAFDTLGTATDAGPRNTPLKSTDSAGTAPGGRDRIDRLDQQIIQLLQQRIEASHVALTDRVAHGGHRVDLSRENEVIMRYRTALGRPGAALAVTLVAHDR